MRVYAASAQRSCIRRKELETAKNDSEVFDNNKEKARGTYAVLRAFSCHLRVIVLSRLYQM